LVALIACGSVKDHPGMEVTLSQTNSENVTSGVGCRTEMTNYVRENNFYRAFRLADYGVMGAFHVKKVSFGVATAISGGMPANAQPAEILLFGYSGDVGGQTVDLSKLTKQADMMIQVPDSQAPTVVDIPITAAIPPGSMVVQLHIPDGDAAKHQLMIGANQQGESAPAYQLAPLCGETAPVTFPAAGLSIFALVLTVTGDG